MTEEEAKTKWCPFSRVEIVDGNGGVSGGNRGGGITNCIASACMAWRDSTYTETVVTQPTSTSAGVRHVIRPGGYCGLAGKP